MKKILSVIGGLLVLIGIVALSIVAYGNLPEKPQLMPTRDFDYSVVEAHLHATIEVICQFEIIQEDFCEPDATPCPSHTPTPTGTPFICFTNTPTPTWIKTSATPTKSVHRSPTPTKPRPTPTPTVKLTPTPPPSPTPTSTQPPVCYQWLCHKPGTAAEQNYCCDSDGCVDAHLKHGDYLGKCQ